MKRKMRSSLTDSLGFPPETPPADALSVGDLTGQIREVLEGTFSRVRVFGEVIGLAEPRSGHVYFSLKDSENENGARISVVMWRDRARRLRFPLEDGLLVTVEGRLTVYEPRGTYQVIADQIQPAGQGTLLVAFERLKEKLWKEGLLDPARKVPLPFLPQRIGLITSTSGAAVHDVLRSIYRKFPAWVRIAPVRVQGEGSADDIVGALGCFDADPPLVDVVILARGGGSLEDLWTFNEEVVARAVAACRIPTISGVGHEVDTTLVDLVADMRAQTPTHAGELVVADFGRLTDALRDSRARLIQALLHHHGTARERVRVLGGRLRQASPLTTVAQSMEEVDRHLSTLKKTLYNRFREWEDQLSFYGGKLDALNPLLVLKRGYSVTQNTDGDIVRNATDLKVGDDLAVLLAEGQVDVRVTKVRNRPTVPLPPSELPQLGNTADQQHT